MGEAGNKQAVAKAFDAWAAGAGGVSTSWRQLHLRDGSIVDAVAFFDIIDFNDFWARVTPEGAAQR
jgi:hypothetical protein